MKSAGVEYRVCVFGWGTGGGWGRQDQMGRAPSQTLKFSRLGAVTVFWEGAFQSSQQWSGGRRISSKQTQTGSFLCLSFSDLSTSWCSYRSYLAPGLKQKVAFLALWPLPLFGKLAFCLLLEFNTRVKNFSHIAINHGLFFFQWWYQTTVLLSVMVSSFSFVFSDGIKLYFAISVLFQMIIGNLSLLLNYWIKTECFER